MGHAIHRETRDESERSTLNDERNGCLNEARRGGGEGAEGFSRGHERSSEAEVSFMRQRRTRGRVTDGF